MSTSAGNRPSATVLLFHGSRRTATQAEAHALAARLTAENPGLAVACAFLEHGSPGIAEALAQLVHAGHRSIAAVPLFALTGRHVEDDLPQLIAAFKATNPAVDVVLTPHLSASPWFVEALAGHLRETQEKTTPDRKQD